MTAELKVSLGLRADGSVVHITEIDPVTERGLACGCICAQCGEQLVARVGSVRQRHFAHHRICECVGADESALHRFAKEVFTRHHALRVPEARVWVDAEMLMPLKPRPALQQGKLIPWRDRLTRLVSSPSTVRYREAVLEQPLPNGLRPDVTLIREKGKPPFLVEIRVRHAVDEAKEAALKELGLPCIEIDLSEHGVTLDSFNRRGIELLVMLAEGSEKSWLCIPGEQEIARELADALLAEEEAYEKESQRDEHRTQVRLAKQDALLTPEASDKREAQKASTLAENPTWRMNCRILGVDPNNVPYYLDEPVKGEYLFAVHRSVWQSTLYLSWVWNKNDPSRSQFISVKYAVDNLRKHHPEFFVPDLLWAYRDRGDVRDPAAAVGDFFLSLRDCGFLEEGDGKPWNPYSWNFRCVVPRVVPLPPQYNGKRYIPRSDGVWDRETERLVVRHLSHDDARVSGEATGDDEIHLS